MFAPISYLGELAYHGSDGELRQATGPGIEWTGKWCEVEYADLEMEAAEGRVAHSQIGTFEHTRPDCAHDLSKRRKHDTDEH